MPTPPIRFLALLMLLIAGCASRPYATLTPVARTVPGAQRVDMLVATTRAPSNVSGVVFGPERGRGLSLENIVVSIPPARFREPGDIAYPSPGAPDPARQFVALKVEPLDPAGAHAWYKSAARPKRRILIFVHGFNSSYEEAVFRLAQISQDSGADAAPILFTWPSGGSVFDYLYDRDSANYSRDSLEAVIAGAAASPDVGEITLMAHSMGGWLAMEAVRQLAIRQGNLPPKLANIVLAAPDIDLGVFRTQLDALGPAQDRITIFAAQDDQALLVSRRLAGGSQRLGSIDLSRPDLRAEMARRGIVVVDISGIRTGDPLNHTTFAQSPAVVQAIGNRLIAGDGLSDGRLGLADAINATVVGTTQGLGSAVGAAIELPGALVSGDSRQRLGSKLGRAGRSLGGSLQTAIGR